jgi:hypothetical protein
MTDVHLNLSLDNVNEIFKIPILYSEYLSYRYGNWNTVVQDYDYFNDDKSLHKV